VLLAAFETDVRPLLTRLREELGIDPDPVEAFRRSGEAERLARERGTSSVESAYERT
jgi:L-rhamnose isomerase/sugar isomerase